LFKFLIVVLTLTPILPDKMGIMGRIGKWFGHASKAIDEQ
jgi:hypothetical protein